LIAVVNDDFTRARRIGPILRQRLLKNGVLKNTIRARDGISAETLPNRRWRIRLQSAKAPP
jgi:hypothetical protein